MLTSGVGASMGKGNCITTVCGRNVADVALVDPFSPLTLIKMSVLRHTLNASMYEMMIIN